MNTSDPIRQDSDRWPLGIMIVCGYEQHPFDAQLDTVRRLGATHVELYPHWRTAPAPEAVGRQVQQAGLHVWSAHGPWGNESWSNSYVDLGSPHPTTRLEAVAQIRRALDWLAAAGGRHLVVHPGGLSEALDFDRRRAALLQSLMELASATEQLNVHLCVENMPRGAFPGSFTKDNAAVVREVNSSHIGLCLDTGHANIMDNVANEARAARGLLRTTHVHDNDGTRDSHRLPGLGTISWPSFDEVLLEIDYQGVIMLECPRYLRENPELVNDSLRDELANFCQKRKGV